MDNDVFIEMRTLQRTKYPASSVKVLTACPTLVGDAVLSRQAL